MKRYPRVHRRFFSLLIDYTVVYGLETLLVLALGRAQVSPSVIFVGFVLLVPIYFIVTQALWGQTVGKYLLGIRLLQTEGGPASWGRVTLRYLPHTLWAALYAVGIGISASRPDPDVYASAHALDRGWMIYTAAPGWFRMLGYAWPFWLVINLVVLLISRANRALHDLIAGTVVLDAGPST